MIDAVQAVDPDSDVVDGLTYARIVPSEAGKSNERQEFGNAGLAAMPGKGDMEFMLKDMKNIRDTNYKKVGHASLWIRPSMNKQNRGDLNPSTLRPGEE